MMHCFVDIWKFPRKTQSLPLDPPPPPLLDWLHNPPNRAHTILGVSLPSRLVKRWLHQSCRHADIEKEQLRRSVVSGEGTKYWMIKLFMNLTALWTCRQKSSRKSSKADTDTIALHRRIATVLRRDNNADHLPFGQGYMTFNHAHINMTNNTWNTVA